MERFHSVCILLEVWIRACAVASCISRWLSTELFVVLGTVEFR